MVALRHPGFLRRVAKVLACLWVAGTGPAFALDYPTPIIKAARIKVE
jgi:hypothetical protein